MGSCEECLVFLFFPLDAAGHVTSYIGLGQELLAKGHTVVFAISNGWKGKLAKFGFIEKYFQDENLNGDLSIEKWGEMIRTMTPALSMPPLDKLEHFHTGIYAQLIATAKEADERLRQIVAEIKPHLIIVDIIHNPSLSDVGIPWVLVASVNPVGFAVDNVPPALSGYPAIDGDENQWNEFYEKAKKIYGPMHEDFREWILEKGGSNLEYDGRINWCHDSPYANMYMYPREMSYTMHRPDPPNWYQFDTFIRSDPQPFQIPTQLDNIGGKLIYISLGTIGCSELGLMRKIIGICSKSPNRFIVSKGPLGDELELGGNMWGQNNLPQTNILPLVDLVITHGGNNTITESFYAGKKVLVLPLFADQLDNGQRVEETGLGLQFDPYKVTEEQLLTGIETLLGNELLERRMKTIATRIQGRNGRKEAGELLEHVAQSNAFSHSIYYN